MCDAAWDWWDELVEHLEVSNDTSSGCESSRETEEVSLSVKAQVQPLRKQKIVVRPVCVRRDSDFKKVPHDTIKNSGIVRTKGGIVQSYNPYQ
jgi:hypothetical protein